MVDRRLRRKFMNTKFIRLPNGTKMECYDCIVNSMTCEIKFINESLEKVKSFIGKEIIDYIDILDKNGKIIKTHDIYAKRQTCIFEETTIKESETRVIKEAYDEVIPEIIDEETGEVLEPEQTIHYPEETETIFKDIPVEMITVIMDKPSIKEEIVNLKQVVGIVNPNCMTLEEFKDYYISLSNSKLASYLAEHPLVSNCHNNTLGTYNITKDKQDLMTSNYITYTIKKATNPNTILTWNESGEECEVWKEEEYLQLIVEIEAIVKPLVSKQQSLEKEIVNATSLEMIKSIELDYSNADIRNTNSDLDK